MKVCNFSLGKFFIFLCFSFISIFNLSAACVKVEDKSFIFLSQDGEECINKSESGILPIPNGGVNNFDVLIPGKNDGGYTIELVFDRDNQVELSGEQSLFAFYSSEDAINPVSELVLKGSSIFYKVNNTNTEDQEGVDLSGSAFNDPDIINPHAIIIVHDNVDNQVIFNIDGAELKIPDVPSVNATDIKNVKIGKNYVGNISEFRIYSTELSLKERSGAVKLLAGITGAKIAAIELVKDENGVTRSAVDSSKLVKCKAGQTIINGKCNNAIVSGFIAPSNSIYNGSSDIQYDPAHNGQANAKLLDCNIGYEVGSVSPKYWFTLNGDLPSVHIEGSCVARDYSANFIGIAGISNNLTSVIYSSSSKIPLPCQSNYSSHSEDGYSFDNVTGDITVDSDNGGCIAINYVFGDPADITPISASGFYIDGVLKTKDEYNTNDYLVLPSAAIDGKFDPVSGDQDFYTLSGFHYGAGLGLSGYLNDSINSNSRHIYVIFYLDNLYDLSQLKIWNWGWSGASTRSLLEADIYLSTDNGNSWGSANTMNFSVRTSDTAEIKTLTGPANAVKVRFKKNGANTWVGFDEIKFVAASKFRDYRSEFTGISNIKTTDPVVIYNSSYNSPSNMAPLPCNDGFESSPDSGYYFDTTTENITVIAGGGCTPPQPIYTFIGGVLGDSSGTLDKIWCLHDKDGSSTSYAQYCQTWPTEGDWANQEEFNPNQDYSEGLSIGFRLNHNTRVDNISPYVFGPIGPGAVDGGERGVQAQTSGDYFYVQAENKDSNKNIQISGIYGNNAWLFSYHPNGSVTVYKNGSIVGSGDVGFVGSQVEKNGLFLGSRVPEDPNNFFKGSSITDLKIWNKSVNWSATGY
jgi:hypothetical protein